MIKHKESESLDLDIYTTIRVTKTVEIHVHYVASPFKLLLQKSIK